MALLQEAVQEAAALHCGHSEELPRLLLEEEVSAAPLGGAHLPETSERSAGPPSVRPATRGEEEDAGGGGGGEVGDIIPDESVTDFCISIDVNHRI